MTSKRMLIVLLFSLLVPIFVVQEPLTAQTAASLPRLKEGEPLPHDLFIKLNKVINPAVVNISTTYLPKAQRRLPYQGDPFFNLFEQFMGPGGGPMGPSQQRPEQSLGTGFIIREDGLIITNNHVIDKADVIKVQIDEKSEKLFTAKVIGRDPKSDIALLKIESKKPLPVVKLGSSADLQVGQWVAAFGNPYGHGHTMTKGIVSALGREIDEINLAPFIQTDASINPGNSGGPLVDTQGLVIGVNTAIDPRGQGIGFAIPIDHIKSLLPSLEKDGTIRRAFLGIQMGELTEDAANYLNLKTTDGAFVLQVLPSSPADRAGFREYDVITELDGQKVKSWRDVQKTIARTTIGKEIPAKVLRSNKTVALKVKLGEQPAEPRLAEGAKKKTEGQNAPFNFGFKVSDFTPALAREFGSPPVREPGPIVTEVAYDSDAAVAGLSPGDMILDVDKVRVPKVKDLFKALKENKRNILRVLKRDRVVLLELKKSSEEEE